MRRPSSKAHLWSAVFYALLAVLVLGPLLKPGYVLALDMVFTPRLRMPGSVISSYLFHAGLRALNFILPGDVIEKLVLLAAFWLAGVGAFRLTRACQRRAPYDTFGAYFAGVCYTVNPFTYDRLMAGQYSVLLGYALMPFFVLTLLQLLRRPTVRTGVSVGLWATLIAIVSIHMIGMMVVLAAAGVVGNSWRHRAGRQLWKTMGVAAAVFMVLGSYWLVPLALGKGATAAEVRSFSTSDARAFATTGWGAPGRFANVLHLQGFWAEDRGLFALPQSHIGGFWGELSVVLAVLIAVGAWWAWRRQRFVFGLLSAGTIAGILLSMGLFTGLTKHLSLLAGYREPQKFETLIALGYSVFAGFGIAVALRRLRAFMQSRAYAAGAAVVLFGVPFIFTSTLLWGARGQLVARPYPADWAAANQFLDTQKGQFHTLFLPWHEYMYFGFAGRIVTNPAPAFFDRPVITSDNPEFNGAAPVQPTPAKQAFDALLPAAPQGTMLGAALAPWHVKYVMFDRDDDYQKYEYLNRQTDLHLVFAGRTLLIYQNKEFR